MPDYFVGNAPSGASYTPPRVDFSAIGDAPDTYFKGTQQRRIQALQNAFPKGLNDPELQTDGKLDINKFSDRLLKTGGADYAAQLLPFLYGQQAGGAVDTGENIAGGGMGGQPEPRPHTVDTGPADIMRGQPKLSSRGTDDGGAATIRQMATELAGGQDASNLIRAAAMKFRIGPDQELSPEQEQAVRQGMTQLRGSGGSDLPGPSPSGMVAGPGVPPQNGGQPVAQPGPMAPAASGPQAAPVGPTPGPAQAPPNPNAFPPLSAAANHDKAAAYYTKQAAAAAKINPAEAKAFEQRAQQHADTAKQIREFHAKQNEFTGPEKEASRLGMNPLQYKQQQEIQATDTKRSEDLNNGLQSMANISAPMIENLRQQKAMVNHPDFTSGNFNEAELWLKRQFPSIAGQPTSMELYRKTLAESISTEMSALRTAAEKAGEAAGRIFMPQIKQIETMSGGLDNSVTGLRALAEIRMRTHQRNIDLANFASAYKTGDFRSLPSEFQKYKTPLAPGLLGPGFERGMRDWIEHHPLFNAKETSDPRVMGAREPPPMQSKQEAQAWAARVGLKPGEPIRINGNVTYWKGQ